MASQILSSVNLIEILKLPSIRRWDNKCNYTDTIILATGALFCFKKIALFILEISGLLIYMHDFPF